MKGRYLSSELIMISDNGVINNQLVVIKVKGIEPANMSVTQCAPAITRGKEKITVIKSAHKKERKER